MVSARTDLRFQFTCSSVDRSCRWGYHHCKHGVGAGDRDRQRGEGRKKERERGRETEIDREREAAMEGGGKETEREKKMNPVTLPSKIC